MRNAVLPRGGDDVPGGGDVIVEEGLFVQRADLRVIKDERARAGEGRFPGAGSGKIGLCRAEAGARRSQCWVFQRLHNSRVSEEAVYENATDPPACRVSSAS